MPEPTPEPQSQATPQPPASRQTMAQLGDAIAACPLNELALPGAHRAGSATVPPGPGSASNSASRCLRCAQLLAPDSVAGWLRTQDLGITQLLEAGVRYFDLRSVADDQGQVRIGFPGSGSPVGTVIEEVRDYLQRQPAEIVILQFRGFHAFTASVYQDFAEALVKGFGDLLLRPDERGARVPVGELWSRKARVIVAFPDAIRTPRTACGLCGRALDGTDGTTVSLRADFRSAFWPDRLVRAEDSQATSLTALKRILAAELHEPWGKRLMVLDATLQPTCELVTEGQIGRGVMFFKDGEDLLARCLPGFLRAAIPRFWRDCFPSVLADARLAPTRLSTIGRDRVTPKVIEWLRDDWPAQPLNIVSADGVDGSGLIELLHQRNEATAAQLRHAG